MAQPLRAVQPDNEPQQSASVQQDTDTHVVISRDGEHHETTTVEGHRVNFQSQDDNTTRVSGSWSDEADEHVRNLIAEVTSEREERENKRANARNFNRMLMLFGALVLGLVITYVLNNGLLGSWGPVLAPYAFVITILMDSGLAAYAYVKHY